MINQQARWLNQFFSYLFIFFPLVTPGTVIGCFVYYIPINLSQSRSLLHCSFLNEKVHLKFTTASSPQQIWPPYSFRLLSGPVLSFFAHYLHIGVGRFDRLF